MEGVFAFGCPDCTVRFHFRTYALGAKMLSNRKIRSIKEKADEK
jgi:hypothetical protein